MKNKKENKIKTFTIFIAVMVVLYVAGWIFGRLIARGERNGSLERMISFLKNDFVKAIPPFYLLLTVASSIIVFVLYMQCKRMYKTLQANPEDDDLWDCLENKMNQPLLISNVMQIIDIFFFGCIVWAASFASYGRNGGYETVVLAIDCVLFFALIVVNLVISRGLIEIEKKLNPEKRGNVFDLKFNQVWLESCDEAQKLIAYQAGYASFKNTNFACTIMWVLAFVGMFMFKTGIFPLLAVCAIWLVSSVSYMLRAAKLERGMR